MTEADLGGKWYKRLCELGAIWEYQGGPVIAQLTLSNKVSDFYFNSDVIHSFPGLIEQLCAEVFLPEIEGRGLHPDAVLTFAPFGLPLATLLSLKLRSRMGYITSGDVLSYCPKPGEQSIIVTDDVWSGGSVQRIIRCLRDKHLADPRLIVAFGNCSREEVINEIEIFSLFKRTAKTWLFEDCPFAGTQGVKAIEARDHWELSMATKGVDVEDVLPSSGNLGARA